MNTTSICIVIIFVFISIIQWIKRMIYETASYKAHSDIECLHAIIEDANKTGSARNFKSDNALLVKIYDEWLEYFLKYQLDLKINDLKKKMLCSKSK